MIGVAIASFLLLSTVVYLIAAPLLLPADEASATARLREERGRLLAQIGDLDMEFQTGKLDDEEYLELRARREGEIEAIDAAIETAAQDGGDDDLERRVAERRRAITTRRT